MPTMLWGRRDFEKSVNGEEETRFYWAGDHLLGEDLGRERHQDLLDSQSCFPHFRGRRKEGKRHFRERAAKRWFRLRAFDGEGNDWSRGSPTTEFGGHGVRTETVPFRPHGPVCGTRRPVCTTIAIVIILPGGRVRFLTTDPHRFRRSVEPVPIRSPTPLGIRRSVRINVRRSQGVPSHVVYALGRRLGAPSITVGHHYAGSASRACKPAIENSGKVFHHMEILANVRALRLEGGADKE